MDSSWTQELLNWLTANPGWAGFWVFVMSFVESLAFVGILVPGIIILFGIGAMISLGAMDLLPIRLWGVFGCAVGGHCQLRHRASLSKPPGRNVAVCAFSPNA